MPHIHKPIVAVSVIDVKNFTAGSLALVFGYVRAHRFVHKEKSPVYKTGDFCLANFMEDQGVHEVGNFIFQRTLIDGQHIFLQAVVIIFAKF